MKAKQREMVISVHAMQERERERIMRDLHDEIGLKLSEARWAIRNLEGATEVDNKALDHTEDVITEVVEDIRTIALDIPPIQLKNYTLAEAVAALKEKYIKLNAAFTLSFAIDTDTALSTFERLNLYRMVEEMLHNALKHAGKCDINLSIKIVPNVAVQFNYDDNGIGYNARKTKKGLGTNTLRSRADVMNARFQFSSSPGKGVHYKIIFSIKRKRK